MEVAVPRTARTRGTSAAATVSGSSASALNRRRVAGVESRSRRSVSSMPGRGAREWQRRWGRGPGRWRAASGISPASGSSTS